MRNCDKERAARASVGFGNWEKGLDRQLGPVDEPWVVEVDEHPGERVPSRRLTEQGTPSTLESSLASSASAPSGEIGESAMGAVCSHSAFTYCRRRSASRPRSRDPGDGGTASEGCAASTRSTDESCEELLLAAGEGVSGLTGTAGRSVGRGAVAQRFPGWPRLWFAVAGPVGLCGIQPGGRTHVRRGLGGRERASAVALTPSIVGRASSPSKSVLIASARSDVPRSVAGVRLTRRSMAFAKLSSAARTCISPGAMRVVR